MRKKRVVRKSNNQSINQTSHACQSLIKKKEIDNESTGEMINKIS